MRPPLRFIVGVGAVVAAAGVLLFAQLHTYTPSTSGDGVELARVAPRSARATKSGGRASNNVAPGKSNSAALHLRWNGSRAQPPRLGPGQPRDELLPGSSDCGSEPHMLVVGVLASASPRSYRSRAAIRKTWAKASPIRGGAIVKFLLALDAAGDVPTVLAEEGRREGDIVFLKTRDLYENLSEKVRLFYKWVADWCATDHGSPTFVLKTDDDSFVRLDLLAAELRAQPATRLVYGRIMKKMPGGKNKRGVWDPDNTHKLMTWPWYASGAGYVVSMDVARFFAYPPLPLAFHKNEDRRLGVVLFGFNVTFVDAPRFYPWGHCKADAILIHYNRRAELMERRHARVLAGKNVCGEPWPSGTICARAAQRSSAQLECPEGGVIQKAALASFGAVLEDQDHARYPWCAEGMDGIEIDESCQLDVAKQVEKACVGKSKCEVRAVADTDPCPHRFKHLQVVVKCKLP